jgi:outer membrane protein insertion porin family
VFADAGNVYAEEENFFYLGNKIREQQRSPGDPELFNVKSLPLGLFWSVGFGFRWFSPIGPLRFEWGIPLTRRPSDDKGPLFEFSIGNSF